MLVKLVLWLYAKSLEWSGVKVVLYGEDFFDLEELEAAVDGVIGG